MDRNTWTPARGQAGLCKAPTGIAGLDEITSGGLPAGRPTLVCGSTGCGKTLFAMGFLVAGATRFDEPGVFMAFEEQVEELAQNVASLGYDLPELIAAGKLAVDYVHLDRSEIEETGEYDLEGLFLRLGHAIDSIGAKRVVLDSIETLFSGLSNAAILRSELRRLFGWLKQRGVTAVITAERGEGTLTRHGIEEYISDCVILLDHRVTAQLSTRRLRIVKYRGSTHGTNEFPFLIDDQGFRLLPVTSAGLEHKASVERISTGIGRLDEMLGGRGYYRGSSILLAGTAGTGKTSVAAHFVDAACRRGERCIYFAFEESSSQVIRNMRSIGINLELWVTGGLLHFHAARPSLQGLELHLSTMQRLIEDVRPSVVVIDPMSSLISIGAGSEVHDMLLRLIDMLKSQGITALFNCLDRLPDAEAPGESIVSSLMDTIILLRDRESGTQRRRGLMVLKSRGMAHATDVRHYRLTGSGLCILDAEVD